MEGLKGIEDPKDLKDRRMLGVPCDLEESKGQQPAGGSVYGRMGWHTRFEGFTNESMGGWLDLTVITVAPT